MKRFLIFLVVAVILGAGGWFAYQRFVVQPRPKRSRLRMRLPPSSAAIS